MKNLPDYSALTKLAEALWQQDSAYHGAAIMVGAGFSRCAASAGDVHRKLPLWADLSTIMAKDLGAGASSDPLRLAEEYCAYFGKQALHDLVKKEINDVAWAPGKLHTSLLELPWSEILTTNWDTLLDRASLDVHQPVYSVVCKQEDLSSARSPRIVKLHGTVDGTEDLVFAQEDFRKYPQKQAAFVNFARQVFIENELCLLGFSGDDPNFLQWAGWVRDQLATHARRIYLVGALNLTAGKRKYLESINVAPIDLEKLVADYDDSESKHERATELFLNALKSLKPKPASEWSLTQLHRSTTTTEELLRTANDPSYAAALLESQITVLENDRNSYPSWLVCPTGLRRELQNQISEPTPTPTNISELPSKSRAKLLYEIAWRHSVTYEVLSPWLTRELLTICDPAKPCALPKRQQLEVALLLLKNTRWFDHDESRRIEHITTAILEENAKHWPESVNELAFHQAIVARGKFDYSAIEKLVEKIREQDPVSKLRKSSLLAELGRFNEGEVLVAEAYRELLGQYRNDRGSIYVLSRLAWAHWLLRGVEALKPGKTLEPLPSRYQDSKCSPWDHIEHIREEISEALVRQQKQQDIEPSFEPGRYKDNSDTRTFISEINPILLLEGISDSVGIPVRWGNVSFLAELGSKLTGMDDVDDVHRFSVAIRAANSETSDALKKVFSRNQIACLPEERASNLLNHCISAISFWGQRLSSGTGEQRGYALDRLRVFIEVCARVSVRATPEQAKHLLRLAIGYGKNPAFHHFWLFDALKHLIDYSIESIPNSQLHEMLSDTLSFPLQSEISIKDHKEWPNPVINLPAERTPDAALDRRIDEIIDRIAPCSPQSGPALIRLLPLLKHGFLTDGERLKLAAAIWGAKPTYQAPPKTGLFAYILLKLPAQDTASLRRCIRKYLFEAHGEELFDVSLLADIGGAAQAENVKEIPDEDQATDYFNRLACWRPTHHDYDAFGFYSRTEKQKGELIGTVLSHSVVPALPPAAMTDGRFGELHSFYSEVDSPESIIGLVYFATANIRFVDRVEKAVGKALRGKNSNKVAYSSYALLRWRENDNSPATERLISKLIYAIESIQTPGLPALLWTANQLYLKGYLSRSNTASLAEVVPSIFDSADYRNIPRASREAVSVSLLRAACVRLARDMLNNSQDRSDELLRVLAEAERDPLPEVRFAMMQ